MQPATQVRSNLDVGLLLTMKSMTELYSSTVSWSKIDWLVRPERMYCSAGHA